MRRSQGFSLIEILVAILIAGIVAAIAIPVFNGQREKAKDGKAQAELEHALRQARAVWARDEGFGSNAVAQMQTGDTALNVQAGASFPAQPGSINANVDVLGRIELRSKSAAGNEMMIVDDPQTGETYRYTGSSSTAGALATVTNLVTNPSLETSLYRLAQNGAGTPPALTRDTATSRWGTSSVRVDTPGGGLYQGVTFQGEGGPTGNYIPITAGQKYTVSGWVRGAVGGEQVEIRASQRLADGALGVEGGRAYTMTRNWQRLTYTFTADPATSFLWVKFVQTSPTYPAVTFYVDGVQAVDGDDPMAFTVGAGSAGRSRW